MYHQHFAGNCFEAPSERCFEDGLGPIFFDCSGFIVRVLCDVTGADIAAQAKGARHVRDMWRLAEQGEGLFAAASEHDGHILVTSRCYTLHGQPTVVPGHVGFVTRGQGEATFIHADPLRGSVQEIPLAAAHSALGYVALRPARAGGNGSAKMEGKQGGVCDGINKVLQR